MDRFDRSRAGHATNPLSCSLLGLAQVRIGLGKRLAFHGYILADPPCADASWPSSDRGRIAAKSTEPRELDTSGRRDTGPARNLVSRSLPEVRRDQQVKFVGLLVLERLFRARVVGAHDAHGTEILHDVRVGCRIQAISNDAVPAACMKCALNADRHKRRLLSRPARTSRSVVWRVTCVR